VLYRERLWVPLTWWLLGALFVLSVVVAVGAYLGPRWGLLSGLVSLAAVGAIFAAASVVIRLEPGEFVVGRARIAVRYLAGAIPLDKAAAAHRSGPGADARAFLVMRPYVHGAVEIILDDPDDPVPYWLVSSRHAKRLASAISAVVGAKGGLH
jgi:Protein of unknown function (DUF3093)